MKKNKFFAIALLTASVIMTSAFIAPTKITVKGSDTIVILAQRWA